jgi:hypothetical protein
MDDDRSPEEIERLDRLYESHLRKKAGNDNYDADHLAMIEESKRGWESLGFTVPRTKRGNEIMAEHVDEWHVPANGLAERGVRLGRSLEGFHYAIDTRDSIDPMTWSGAFPTYKSADKAGKARLESILRNPEGEQPEPTVDPERPRGRTARIKRLSFGEARDKE